MAHGISVPSGGRAVFRGPRQLLALRGDDHLVERLRSGDETAFEVIYERHVQGLLSFCRHMLGSPEEAEDAVQHAFTAAHGNLLRDGREISLKPWLYAIARNRCVSMLRARREHPAERLETSTDGLADEVQQRADLRELLEDLQDLPEDQRAALVLSELDDLSHAEVADILGCRVANVKGLVFRARAGLGERREARNASCESIREELSVAKGGALRRGNLRHHLRTCAGCSGYLQEVRRQRQMMALILPVVPSMGLKSGVLAAVGIGGGAAGGGGAAAGGGLLAALLPASGATVAKVAAVGALVAAGGGLAGKAALDDDGSPARSPSAVTPLTPAAGAPGSPFFGLVEPAEATKPASADEEKAKATRQIRQAQKKERRLRRKANRGRSRTHRSRPVKPRKRRVRDVRGPAGGRLPAGAEKPDRAPPGPGAEAVPPARAVPVPREKLPKETGRSLDKAAPPPPVAPTDPEG